MAAANPLWGAERIRGELGKLGLAVAKRTIQTYLRAARAPRRPGQTWATFLRNHARESGPANSSRSPTCASGRTTRSSSSSLLHAGWRMSA